MKTYRISILDEQTDFSFSYMDLKVYDDDTDEHVFTEEMVDFPLKKAENNCFKVLREWLRNHRKIEEEKNVEVVIDREEGCEIAEYAHKDDEKCPSKVTEEKLMKQRENIDTRSLEEKIKDKQ